MNYRNDDIYRHNKAVIRRRRAEVRRQKLILHGVLITAVLLITLLSGARITFAKAGGDHVKRVKQYKSVMIQCGDSMDTISQAMYTDDFRDMGSFVHEVNMINHLDEDEELIAGNYLTIPYFINVTAE